MNDLLHRERTKGLTHKAEIKIAQLFKLHAEMVCSKSPVFENVALNALFDTLRVAERLLRILQSTMKEKE